MSRSFSPSQGPFSTAEIQKLDESLRAAMDTARLPSLPPQRSKGSSLPNDHLVYTNGEQEPEAPWYRLAHGWQFAGLAGGKPLWIPAVRLISRMPANLAGLYKALAELGIVLPAREIPWIGVPQLHVSSKTLASRAADRLRIGHSIRALNGNDGTITLFFRRDREDAHYLLTSGHVATRLGHGAVGDHLVRVPKPVKAGQRSLNVAALAPGGASPPGNAFPSGAPSIQADYAIAQLLQGIAHDYGRLVGDDRQAESIRAVGPVPVPGPNPTPGVSKVGAGSGRTYGTITAVNVDIPIIDPTTGRFIRFEQQIEITPQPAGGLFSREGDSGALVFDQEMTGVAMVNGGTGKLKEGTRTPLGLTFASPVEPILDAVGGRAAL